MTTPPPAGPKRTAGRKKQTTEQGRAILQRERRRMAREQASEAEEMVEEYRRQLEHREARLKGVEDPVRKTQRAIDRGLIKRVAGVLASEDLSFSMHCSPSTDARSSAWTDFKSINIRYGLFKDHKGVPNYRMIAANLRGLAYHEGGHIRFTIPFKNLVALATGVEDSNRYDHLHRPWNILEDQRMETAVVSDSPAKAKYFLPMVMEHNCPTNQMLAMNYPYIVWRKYLPEKLRRQGRKLFIKSHPNMDDAKCTEMEQIIERYVMATTPTDMLRAIEDFHQLWIVYIARDIPEDSTHKTENKRPAEELTDEMFDIPISPDFEDDEPEAPADGDADGSGEGAEGDAAGEDGGDGEGKTETETKSGGGNGAGAGDPDDYDVDMTDTDLHDMMAEAEEVRDADRQLDADELSMYEAAQEYGSTLNTYSTGVNSNAELVAIGENLAYEVENAFHAATMDKTPAWLEQQNRGIINVLRYETRKTGETDFYRQWTDDDQPGFNMAVSILLDYSGSMLNNASELAVAGFASKQACQRLNIPCTVTLWNSGAVLLWDHNDKADFIPTIAPCGGTNPGEALDDLFAQRFEKPVHVVLILTDGSWSSTTAFNDYRTEGTHFIVVSYDKTMSVATRRAEQIAEYGPDVSVGIDNLFQIPRILEQALADAVMLAR